MRRGYLSEHFVGIAAKRLSRVEASPESSNQHEFNGVAKLHDILGPCIPSRRFSATFIYLSDDDSEPLVAGATEEDRQFVTWYDSRENNPKRSEARLYFPTNSVSENFSAGDLLIIARRPDDSLLVVVAEQESTIEHQLVWLFNLGQATFPGFNVKGELESDQLKLEFASRVILENIGIETEDTDENYLDEMLRRFGGAFPTTYSFSAYARDTIRGLHARDDPDAALVAWLEREEVLFRTLERHLIADRLQRGFGDDVDGFIKYSLSVQNRRKSRVGHALQHHVNHVLKEHRLECQTQAKTENKTKPDFLFPSERAYRDASFDSSLLTMLGVKSTCKDRWRQVLAEADRIEKKHLLTLEPGITVAQTDEMESKGLQLVVPAPIHPTYGTSQREWLKTFRNFIAVVDERQQRYPKT